MAIWKDQGRRNGGPLFNNGAPAIPLKGPVEVDISESSLKPIHEYDRWASSSTLEKFLMFHPDRNGLVLATYIDPGSERLTVVLSKNVSTAEKHIISSEIIIASGFVLPRCVATFAWPSEMNNNPASTAEMLSFERGIIGLAGMGHLRYVDCTNISGVFIQNSPQEFHDNAVSIWLYCSNSRENDQWYSIIDLIIGAMNMGIFQIELDDKGSWFKRMRMTTFAPTTTASIKEKMALLETVIEDVALLKSEVGVNASYLKITEKMLRLVEKQKSAVVRIGTVLLLTDDEFVQMKSEPPKEDGVADEEDGAHLPSKRLH